MPYKTEIGTRTGASPAKAKIGNLSTDLQTALCLFNDTIVREAHATHVPIIDLRNICTEAGDYSAVSPIEPSAQGGEKIAKAIAAMLG